MLGGKHIRKQHAAGGFGPSNLLDLGLLSSHGAHAQKHTWTLRVVLVDILLALIVLALLVGSCLASQGGQADQVGQAEQSQQDEQMEPSSGENSSVSLSAAQQHLADELSGLVEDGKTLAVTQRTAIVGANPGFTKKQEAIYQEPVLPSGCEIASLTAVLNSMGFKVGMTDIVDNYLVVDGEHQWGYIASPYEDNGGGFPPAIVRAANGYLQDQNSKYRARDLTGSSFESVCALVEAGYPVLVWTTLYLSEPNYGADAGDRAAEIEAYGTGEEFGDELGELYQGTGSSQGQPGEWYINEHCVALYRVDDGSLVVTDPLAGITVEDYELFKQVYEQCGSMALYIR